MMPAPAAAERNLKSAAADNFRVIGDKMNKVNWGIIGAGDVAEIKSGPAFNKAANSRLIMVMRRNLEKAEDYARRHAVPGFANNTDDIFNNPEINAVYIATPPSSHAEYTIRAASAGKHVYVEKPMALTYAQCTEMIRACSEHGVKLFTAYYRRELEYFKKVKQLLEQEVIGSVKYAAIKLLLPPQKEDYNRNNLPWRVKPEIAGGGYFYDLASHQFDFLDYLFGPVESARGSSANQLNLYDTEDIVTASFKFKSGIIGSGAWCFTMENSRPVDRSEIIGSEGRVRFSFFQPEPIEIIKSEESSTFSIDYPSHVQQPLIETVVKDILGQGKCVSTGISGARTNRVLEEILK